MKSNLMEQRYLLIRRTRFCCSSFSFTKYADSIKLKTLHNIHYAMQRSVQGKQSNREKGWQYVPIYGMVRVEVKPDSVERRTCNGGCKNKNYECLWCSV